MWCDIKCISLVSVPVEEGSYCILNINTAKAFASFSHDQFYGDRRSILYLALYFLTELICNTIFNACISILYLNSYNVEASVHVLCWKHSVLFLFCFLFISFWAAYIQYFLHPVGRSQGTHPFYSKTGENVVLKKNNNLMEMYFVVNSSHWLYFFKRPTVFNYYENPILTP